MGSEETLDEMLSSATDALFPEHDGPYPLEVCRLLVQADELRLARIRGLFAYGSGELDMAKYTQLLTEATEKARIAIADAERSLNGS